MSPTTVIWYGRRDEYAKHAGRGPHPELFFAGDSDGPPVPSDAVRVLVEDRRTFWNADDDTSGWFTSGEDHTLTRVPQVVRDPTNPDQKVEYEVIDARRLLPRFHHAVRLDDLLAWASDGLPDGGQLCLRKPSPLSHRPDLWRAFVREECPECR